MSAPDAVAAQFDIALDLGDLGGDGLHRAAGRLDGRRAALGVEGLDDAQLRIDGIQHPLAEVGEFGAGQIALRRLVHHSGDQAQHHPRVPQVGRQHLEEAGAGVLGDGDGVLVGDARDRGVLVGHPLDPVLQAADGGAHLRRHLKAFGEIARAVRAGLFDKFGGRRETRMVALAHPARGAARQDVERLGRTLLGLVFLVKGGGAGDLVGRLVAQALPDERQGPRGKGQTLRTAVADAEGRDREKDGVAQLPVPRLGLHQQAHVHQAGIAACSGQGRPQVADHPVGRGLDQIADDGELLFGQDAHRSPLPRSKPHGTAVVLTLPRGG